MRPLHLLGSLLVIPLLLAPLDASFAAAAQAPLPVLADATSGSPAGAQLQASEPGGIFVTGHDPDYHAFRGIYNAVGAQHIIQRAIAYVTYDRANPRILLVTDVRSPDGDESDPRMGMQAAGFVFDVADYGSGIFGLLDLRTVNFTEYDVVVVASDYGGWLRQDELDILNARSADIAEYVNTGGGLVVFCEAGGRPEPATYTGTSHDRYAFIPLLTISALLHQSESGVSLTEAGRAMGLVTADVNDNVSHGTFEPNGLLDVIDYDAQGNVLSMAMRGERFVVHSAYGRVTTGGAFLPNVSISAGPTGRATIDANGYYTMTGLITGTYTLVPYRQFWSFSPPSRTVTLPPDATAQDFVATLDYPLGPEISGPARGRVNTGYTFTASLAGITATLPITYTWQATDLPVVSHAGGVTDSASFEWPLEGLKTITLTVENADDRASATHAITVSVPPATVALNGPARGVLNAPITFTVAANPITTSLPLVYVWQASEQTPVYHSDGRINSVSFGWSSPGSKTISVTVANEVGTAIGERAISIGIPPTGASIGGPTSGGVGRSYAFSSSITPVTATLPITYTWQATGLVPANPLGRTEPHSDTQLDTAGEKDDHRHCRQPLGCDQRQQGDHSLYRAVSAPDAATHGDQVNPAHRVASVVAGVLMRRLVAPAHAEGERARLSHHRRAPKPGQVEHLAPEGAQYIDLGQGAVAVALSAPVAFGTASFPKDRRMDESLPVSVVMSVYNGERYLRECVDSILCQTIGNFEFVIINDGSSDNTGAILESYRAADARVHVYNQENRGLIASLNTGCQIAGGEYIARMDADDIAFPDRLERQISFLEHNPEVAVVGGAIMMIRADGTPTAVNRFHTTHSDIREEMKRHNGISHSTVVMRKTAFVDAGGYRAAFLYAEDYDLWLRMGERFTLANLPEPVLYYRLHPQQVSLHQREQQVVSTLGAQAAARIRRETGEDPVHGPDVITPELLARLGIGRDDVATALMRAHLWSTELMLLVGDQRQAQSYLDQALACSRTSHVGGSALSEVYQSYARLFQAQRKTVRSGVSMINACIAHPALASKMAHRAYDRALQVSGALAHLNAGFREYQKGDVKRARVSDPTGDPGEPPVSGEYRGRVNPDRVGHWQ